MRESLRTLLANAIDYAGLFPPAKLPLEQAIRNYAACRASPEAGMLGRFVCNAARLHELAPFHDELFAHGPPFSFSVLGRGGSTTPEFLAGLRDDLRDIAGFRERHGVHISADVLEVRLPADILGQQQAAASLFAQSAELTEEHGPPSLKPFFECPLRGNWRAEMESILAALAEDARLALRLHRHRYHHAGFKLRCGGAEPSAFPAPQQVAAVLVAARNHGVPLKLTAGLHHPIRRFDPGVQASMHGFLNVLVAAVLGATHHLGEDVLTRILECEDAKLFTFENSWLRWQGLSADEGEIGACRHGVVQSFGSCSFDEPRDDLRSLHLL
jgi:hypothetical protein